MKANQLVQAKMPLSKVEHRIIALLISQLDKDDKRFEYQKLPVKELQTNSNKGVPGSLYSRMEDICRSLLDKTLEVKTKEDGKRVYDGINLMNRCRYKEGDGYIEAKFNDEMQPYLLQLKRRFTMYKAGHYVPLDSTYSMRIYELLKMREDIKILRITIEELRDILGVEDSYSYFSELKHHVIKKAQSEIAEKTDLSFTYNAERDGQSAERIKFYIHESGDGDSGRSMKMEDRTESPNIDVIDLFLSDLTQEEINSLDGAAVEDLYQTAAREAKREEPKGPKTVLQSLTYQNMLRLWKEK